ncbi:MAG: cellular apoptosis susceptibility chromosome segregation 1 [Trebouxia sp. A1-2]|nr:MAG: cellular apoptosis susceptibility chromosome segregation 1 [Trebouxia sp. A1-2]
MLTEEEDVQERWQLAKIRAAEGQLKSAAAQLEYGITVLKLIASEAPIEVRQAAAVNFKNFVRPRWAPQNDYDVVALPESEKEQIKGLITGLMLSTPPVVRAQLSEALSIISEHDFPTRWQGLLPQLIDRLKTGDAATINGVLETLNSIYKRYRSQFMTGKLNEELKYSQQLIVPLWETLKGLSLQLQSNSADLTRTKQILSSIRLEMEDTLAGWFAEFHTFMVYDNPALADSDPDKESSVDAMKAAVCQNINLFMEMNEEEFKDYLQTFVQDVWTLLVAVKQGSGQDNLAMNAIHFLTTVASGVHHALFKDANTLKQVCEKIVIPNLMMRDDDEEMFELNWVEYVRRDTEGSDSDTRRRAAAELVTQLFIGYVGSMLQQYEQSPEQNWKAKDCAIYLVMALTVRGKTAAQGATTINQLVNVMDFFKQHVLPELQSQQLDQRPVLKADSLKYLTTFRSQVPKDTCMQIFRQLVVLLGSDSNVVHTYAAVAVDRLLAQREDGKQRFQVQDLAPVLEPLLQALFSAFLKPDSAENEYVMRCIMRVIDFVGPEIAPAIPSCVSALAGEQGILMRVITNPTQPGFNHYLFESVAALVKQGCAKDPRMVDKLEEMLIPPFNYVLSQDVQEFHPYVFQIFAQLIELHPGELPAFYMSSLFQPLLAPLFWERAGNVPALTRLMQAYLIKAAPQIVAANQLPGLLGVFQKLIASKALDHEGYKLLDSMMEHVRLDGLQQYLPTIWQLMLTRLQTAKTPKAVRGFIHFTALFIDKEGAPKVQQSLDAVQPNLFSILLEQIWLPNLQAMHFRHTDQKVVAVAMTKAMVDCPALQTPTAATLWGKVLSGTVNLLEGDDGLSNGVQQDEDLDDGEYAGYSASFAPLHNAAIAEQDILPDVPDAKSYLASSLGSFSQNHQGQITNLINQHVPAELQPKLQGYLETARVSLG